MNREFVSVVFIHKNSSRLTISEFVLGKKLQRIAKKFATLLKYKLPYKFLLIFHFKLNAQVYVDIHCHKSKLAPNEIDQKSN